VKKLRPSPPRPLAVWAATVVVSIHCWSVPLWWLYHAARFGFGPREVLFVVGSTALAAALLGCQVVAVFRRRWPRAWVASGIVGLTFAVPGVQCLFAAPFSAVAAVGELGAAGGAGYCGAVGALGLVELAAGVVMLWWAARLRDWQVRNRSSSRHFPPPPRPPTTLPR
jgi:hypothetical protein